MNRLRSWAEQFWTPRSEPITTPSSAPESSSEILIFPDTPEISEQAEEVSTTTPKNALRNPPPNDAQHDFFVPVLYDVPIKDDISLMDVSPYSLSKNLRRGKIEYRLNDAMVTIDGTSEYGMANIFDYDIVIHMISQLNAEMEYYRKDKKRGVKVELPSHRYQPSSAEILKFCRKAHGGRQYEALEEQLHRLDSTRIIIESEHGGKRRLGSFNLIDGFHVVSRTRKRNIDVVNIGIPGWIYDGIVKQERPSLLTLDRDYFLMKKAVDRSLYRLARKTAGRGESFYYMENIYRRSGSPMRLSDYAKQVRKTIKESDGRILDYKLSITCTKQGERLDISYAGETAEMLEPLWLVSPLVMPELLKDQAYQSAPGWSLEHLVERFNVFRDGKPAPKDFEGSFIGFCRAHYKRYGSP